MEPRLQMTTNRLFMFTLAACLWCASLASAQTVRPLSDVLEDWQGYSWSDIQDIAAWEAQNDGPLYPSAPSSTPAYETFEGNFSPESENSKLAIFSDDGCDVFINGNKVHSRKGRGQALPNLSQSLYKIEYSFQVGQTYQIRIEYSNTSYLGAADIDGASLFVFTEDGGQNAAQRISKLQCSLDGGSNWIDVPNLGAAGYPLQVNQGDLIYFRSVRANLNLTWPSGKPAWHGSGGVEGQIGEYTLAIFDETSQNSTDFKNVSAECFNSVSAQVIVNPMLELYVDAGQNILVGGSGQMAQTPVTAFVVDYYGNPQSGITVNFASKYEDGTIAGSIPNTAVTDLNGEATVNLTSGNRVEDAYVSASFTSNQNIYLEDETTVSFELPKATLTFGEWHLENGILESSCTTTLTYGANNQAISNRAIRLESTVKNDSGQVFPNAAPFNNPVGTTDQNGTYVTQQKWMLAGEEPNNFNINVEVYDPIVEAN